MSGALTLTEFVSFIQRTGLQRSNRWHVHIVVPELVQSELTSLKDNTQFDNVEYSNNQRDSGLGAMDIERTLSLMALNVDVPGMNVSNVEMHVGSTRKIAYDKSTGDINITFRCSGDMNERKLFDAWVKKIFRSDHSVEFYDNYIGDIYIECLSVNDDITYSCYLNEAYPSIITDLNLDRQAADGLLEFQVTFNYRKFQGDLEFYSETPRSTLPVYVERPQQPQDRPVTYGDLPTSSDPNDPTQTPIERAIFKQVDKIKDKIESGELLKAPARKALNMLKGRADTLLGNNGQRVTLKINKVLDKFGYGSISKPLIDMPKLPF